MSKYHLSATLLTRHEQIILYGEEAEANQARRTSEVPLDMLASVSEFAWDGRLWQIEAMTDPAMPGGWRDAPASPD